MTDSLYQLYHNILDQKKNGTISDNMYNQFCAAILALVAIDHKDKNQNIKEK
jgi:hypothetical protein